MSNTMHETLHLERPKVSIIDDSGESRAMYQRLLRDFEVTTFETAEQFYQQFDQLRPDAIVLDVNLPGLSGYDLCKKLRVKDKWGAYLGIVLVSDTIDPYITRKSMGVRADDFVRKSAAMMELKARVESTIRRKKAMDELLNSRAEIVMGLAKAWSCYRHSTSAELYKVGEVAAFLYSKCLYSPEECDLIRYAAMLRDVGMVTVDNGVLTKEGTLTDQERELIKGHADSGFALLAEGDSEFIRISSSIALTHHEWWDGSGYPKGLKGEDIPLEGRIVALVDVLDALLSARAYDQEEWPFERAVEMIKSKKGTHLDPAIVDLFLDHQETIKGFFDGSSQTVNMGQDSEDVA
ncbi:MAG: response regulator [Zetaproteobacteria bacterium]|nr:response regulator [Zetaproteobacteria bacterium]